VLLLHSVDPGCSGILEYHRNLTALSERFRVIVPDLVGFGNTEMPKGPITNMSQAFAAHIAGFMDALRLERVHLIGNSRGGLISISIASSMPKRVGRMILLGNAGGGPSAEYMARQNAAYANFRPSRKSMRSFIGDSFYDFDRDVSPEIFELYMANAMRQYARYDKFGPVPIDVPDLRPELTRIAVPVFYMFGREDKRWPPPHDGLDVFLTTPGSRYLMLSECGHHPQTEHPEDFNLLAPAFLGGQLP
jgi:pimeloyl-ACP methyl ester carboxylesterase